MLTLEVCSPTVVRLVVNHGEPVDDRSWSILTRDLGARAWHMSYDDEAVVLTTSAVRVEVDRASGDIEWRRPDGGRLFDLRNGPGGRRLVPKDVLRTRFAPHADATVRMSADGIRSSADGKAVVDRHAFAAHLRFGWAPDESLHGLGQHDDGLLDLRGTSQYLYQQNTKISVPVLVSSYGYAVVVDSGSAMAFADDADGGRLDVDTVDQLDLYVVVGAEPGDYPGVLAGLTALAGPAPIPPKAIFGYVQSKERYGSQAELVDVAEEFARRGIPLDVLVLDWQSWTGELWGQKTLDPDRFPDPDALMNTLHADGTHLMVSIWPTLNKDAPDHAELEAHGYLLGNRATYDPFQPGARSLYWRQAAAGAVPARYRLLVVRLQRAVRGRLDRRGQAHGRRSRSAQRRRGTEVR
ncbi:TIM-barrel domain-containing protein [Phytohabitans rumicis]|uniref:Uncharacterized protein n=1 Tax=Phytohabitans rumicis TaxID=1076125 RepID=A0A6V8L9D6_9ACTN|nr:TIM-barrel domain-containing protein [Phytohabitans rumicis]GFJ93843.1 hypothetical protein Prum_074850 [Phytohabitans rumicis]